MKSQLMPHRFYIECNCGSPDHLLVFDPYEMENGAVGNMSVYFTSNYKAPWYKRIWYALEFIFNREKFCWGDDIVINHINIKQLQEFINHITEYEKKNEYIKKVELYMNEKEELKAIIALTFVFICCLMLLFHILF